MTVYTVTTLVDISQSGFVSGRPENDDEWKWRNQQRNYDTLCQVISLRTNYEDEYVTTFEIDIESAKSFFNNQNLVLNNDESVIVKVWAFTFETERADVLGPEGEVLKDDLNMVPVIPNLDDSVELFPSCFLTKGSIVNTVVFKSTESK